MLTLSRLSFLVLFFALGACDGVAAEPAVPPDGFAPPDAVMDLDGWAHYLNAAHYEAEDVAGLKPGTASPEAAVVHFFASRIRGDEAWELVMAPSEASYSFIQIVLDEVETWRFYGLQLDSRRPLDADRMLVRVWLDAQARGDYGVDLFEVEVIEVGGEWFVRRPPSLVPGG